MSPSDIAALPRLCLVISADMHSGLMGRMCAFLRQQTLSWSSVDAGSFAVRRVTQPSQR